MAIYRQLRETAFEPAEIVTIAATYEEILSKPISPLPEAVRARRSQAITNRSNKDALKARRSARSIRSRLEKKCGERTEKSDAVAEGDESEPAGDKP
jgi:hypothetical protein